AMARSSARFTPRSAAMWPARFLVIALASPDRSAEAAVKSVDFRLVFSSGDRSSRIPLRHGVDQIEREDAATEGPHVESALTEGGVRLVMTRATQIGRASCRERV